MIVDGTHSEGRDGEELNHLLRSLPQQQAPVDLEPSVLRRVGIDRPRRWLVGIVHSAVRTDWIGGLISAVVSGLVVVGAWQALQSNAPRATRVVQWDSQRNVSQRSIVRNGARVRVETDHSSPTDLARAGRAERTAPSRRGSAVTNVRGAVDGSVIDAQSTQSLDTVIAARLRARG